MDNLDDMINDLNADLNRQMEELNREMDNLSIFDQPRQEEADDQADSPQHFCPQCGNTVTEDMMFCPKCGCKLKQDETPVEQEEETPSTQKKNFILWCEFRYDKQVVFKEIPTEENVRSYQEELESDYEFELTDEMFDNGLLTEDGIQELLDGASDLVSRELADTYDPVVSEILACRVIPNPSGPEEWYNDDYKEWDNSEEFDPDEITLDVDDYDDSEYKARAVYHMHEVHDMFSIQLDNIEDFDPSKVVIRDGHEGGSDFNAYYDGEMLKFLGVGKGDDSVDYEEGIELVKYESPSGEEQEPSSDADSCGKVNLQLFPEAPYRLYLFPIIGEEANKRVDNEGFDVDLSQELEQEYCEQTERKYDIIFDFYASGDGMYYSIDDGDQDELEDNAINIDRSKYDLEEWEEEPDDDFRLIDKLQKDADLNEDNQEVFNDIMNRHNNEEHVDIIVEAICRRLQQVAQQLVDEGLAEDVESVRFALWFGQLSGCQYEFELEADMFDPDALKMIDCTDWNDCSHISEVLQEHWPDRIANCIIYDGKFYQACDGSVDNFNFNADLVDCDLNSLL